MSSGMIILFVAAVTIYFYCRRRSRLPLPPGPPSKFFTGNAHQLPKKEPWRMYATWAESYGPIFSFRVPNRQFIVLNSLKSATELLDSRATTYSDRPKIWMFTELAKRSLPPFNISFNHPYFKMYRTIFKSSLSPRTIQSYQSLQTEQSRVLLDDLHKNPEQFADHIRRSAGAVVLHLAYGWKSIESNDYFLGVLREWEEMSNILLQPGRWLVEVMPSLRFIPSWFPGAGFKRVAFDLGKKLSRLDAIPINWTKQQIKSGSYMHSFVSEQLLPEDGSTVSAQHEEIVKWCSHGIYRGGVDTQTAFSITSFILAMMLYPEVQKHAQAEIDAVVGQDQFPTFKDRGKLPYIGALILELLRWAPVAPQGLSHHAMKEDVYEGYHIPKGATVIPNIYSMSRDKEMYPDPLEFRPERFLGPSPQLDPHKFVFGFGRRSCPGLHFAEASLGEEITLPAEFEGVGLLWRPKPFKCRFIPRNKDLLATLSQ
ncbi:cytochrome P450 [Suillus clintonianus]|uniref:cytochrome P450 n=1 Tax=Suillus clintonianus TaxID=1904413 RepID=UPI001B86FB44|nr:cytochrome P450 [Suillus clintonianus]KAG2140996.1 cytochrome P450 [Suillus clintonianus]